MNCLFCEKPFTPPAFLLYGNPKCCHACNEKIQKRQHPSPESLRESYRRALIPDRYLEIEDTRHATRAKAMAVDAFKRNRPLCLHGLPGTGKTLTLAIFAQLLNQHGVFVQFFHYGDLAALLRENNALMPEHYERLTTVPHLVLDDVGVEADKTGWWTGWIGNIINLRYNKRMPVSSTMNDLTSVDQRICRRLCEDATVIETKELKCT
jgi:DNA replication protein DnaC